MRTAVVAVLLAMLGAPACRSDQHADYFQNVSKDPHFLDPAGDPAAYDSLFRYTPNPGCIPSVPRTLDRKTELRIFRGNGITMDDTARFISGLKRYYDNYGVTMVTRHDVLQVPMDHAVVFNEGAIVDWIVANTAEDPSCLSSYSPTVACQNAMGAAMFYNVKQFLHAYAEPEQNVINVVLLKRVGSLDPSKNMAMENWGVAGLGLSQALVNSPKGSDIGSTSLANVINETNFSPTIFIGVNLTDFVLRAPDIVIAHEMGHAYGLEHLDAAAYGANLMNPTAVKCALPLNSSQLSTVEAATARYGNVLDGAAYDPTEFLSFNHRAPEILDIVRTRIAKTVLDQGASR